MKTCFILVLVAVMSYFEFGNSLKCYECKDCEESMAKDASKEIECKPITTPAPEAAAAGRRKRDTELEIFNLQDASPATPVFKLACGKYIQEKDAKKIYHRACATVIEKDDDKSCSNIAATNYNNETIKCFFCFEDGCNGSSGLQGSLLALLIPILGAVFLHLK